ncbi:MAG: methionine--tRNA ligase, partial [Gammaproteobacteria bacterium]|nr:methionine--tRNA ligase [Gammaproteobacteria bacterium]
METKRHILVTSALPYANAPLHLGHLVEYTQTDVWARFQRMQGHECLYVCASDAHGTPTMLKAESAGVTPDALVQEIAESHRQDFERFNISVDNYLTTHSDENRELTAEIYRRLLKAGHIARRTIEQAYDDEREMFLPDRYVRGICPVCKTPDQYGDSCEHCGATYTPMDLLDPVSVVSDTTPSVRESEHFFFQLGDFEAQLRAWVPEHVETSLVRKLDEWFKAGLRDWDISRDAPYFGFEIPDEPGKYFYVWFDAPIGYMASFLNLCRRTDIDFDAFWTEGHGTELYHFIGKDIVYFHTLFWPAVLSGAGYRKPSGVFVHGFLTVDGQKMSKSRGTFIMASTYAKHLDPDCLRYYFAAKLGPAADDLDLNFDDFIARINADLVGKLVNIASRCAGFIHRLGGGQLSTALPDAALFDAFASEGDAIAADYESLNYSKAIRRIMALADRANQYIDEHKPWVQAKDATNSDQVIETCTLGLNLFRVLIIYLKPVIPDLAARSEAFLGVPPLVWADAKQPLLGTKIERFKALLQRVEPKQIETMVDETRDDVAAQAKQPEAVEQKIDIETFARVDMRVARIITASHVEDADKLLRLEVDLGDETRQILSGIRSAYEPADLEGRLVVVVANLKPRKMRFGTSDGMVLAAGAGKNEIFLLSPDSGAE